MKWNGARIKKLRQRFGETQEEFRKRLRVALPTLRFWEQDQGEPSGPAEELFDRLQDDLNKGRVPVPLANGNGRKDKQPA